MKKILLINFVLFISILFVLEISARIFLKIKLGDQNAGLPMRNKNLEYKPFVMYGENWDQIFKNFTDDLDEENFNVLLIGGSTAENFPEEILEKSLKKKLNTKVKVFNAGYGGYISSQELIILTRYTNKLKPDLVINLNGANDIIHSLKKNVEPGTFYLNNTYKLFLTKPYLAPLFKILQSSQLYNIFLRISDKTRAIINDIGKLTNVPDISEDNPETKIKQQINNKIKLYETLLSGKKKPLTSDEALYETSAMKEIINESLLKVIKETSIDCNIHNKKNKDIMCYTSYSTTDENAFVGKPSIEDEDTDKYIKKNIVMVDFKGITITLKGVDYVLKITDENRQFIKNKEMNKLSGELYDVDSIQDKQPILVGNLSIKDGKQNITMV